MLGRYREGIRACSDPVGRALYRLHLRPNHLTLLGLVMSFLSASAFVADHVRAAGLFLVLAGLFDFFDGSLARASGQVTPFGAFLDSVIDRYSDILVLLGIVVLLARTPNARGAVVAMAGLVGSVMVSYTKARAESIGVGCTVGVMERPERMLCLIAGALFDLLEPALWVLAVLSNVTALQRIAFTWRATREARTLRAVVCAAVLLVPAAGAGGEPAPAETERAWSQAVAAYQAGDAAPLVREFSAEPALKSPIGDYVRYLLANAHARQGDFAQARALARAVADRYPDSRLAPSALLLASTFSVRLGDEATAGSLLARLAGSYPDAAELPEALYLLGMTAEARGDREGAALAYRQLTLLAPASGWAEGASDRLGALAVAGVPIPGFSLSERLERAERLLRGGVPQTAADEAERIASESRDAGLAVRALRVVAGASERLRRYGVAARALEMAAARAPADRKPGLQFDQARMLLRAGQREPALKLLGVVAAKGTEAEAAEATYLKGRVLDDLNRQGEAAAAYRAVAAKYRSREVAGTALWRLGWMEYLRGDVRAAERSWTRLAEIPGGRTYRLAAVYWAARAREQKRGRAAAERLYLQVLREAPFSYYGILAARRVTAPAETSNGPSIRLPADPDEIVTSDPGFERVDLLRRIGLVEQAWQELEEVAQRAAGDPVRLYGVSSTYVKAERYHLALRILRRRFASLAASGGMLPRAFWEMLYPFAWRKEITEAAERAGLDPYLVAALVREESSYYPRAVSRVGARGLMQLMPATAQPMYERDGMPFTIPLLDDPTVNIELGTRFLAGLLRELGDPRLALAAYNAGPRRSREWWRARRTDDVEAFVELIPFDETRQYVKRVMLSWEEYRRIYGGR